MLQVLTPDDALRQHARVPSLAGNARVGRLELVMLFALGVGAAAATTFVNLHLRIPGHHILFAVFPMALGFALVPRRAAGTFMGASAATGLVGFGLLGFALPGPGALVSLLATGPLLDGALRFGRRGFRLHLAFLMAGAAANTLAFVVRAATKATLLPGLAGTRPFTGWFSQAVWTYAAAGLAAGAVSALAWFHIRAAESRE